jgi:hypothetical protein
MAASFIECDPTFSGAGRMLDVFELLGEFFVGHAGGAKWCCELPLISSRRSGVSPPLGVSTLARSSAATVAGSLPAAAAERGFSSGDNGMESVIMDNYQ